jgi:hypothetical protein
MACELDALKQAKKSKLAATPIAPAGSLGPANEAFQMPQVKNDV